MCILATVLKYIHITITKSTCTIIFSSPLLCTLVQIENKVALSQKDAEDLTTNTSGEFGKKKKNTKV